MPKPCRGASALALFLIAFASGYAAARDLPSVDALGNSAPRAALDAPLNDSRIAKAHFEERLGVPTFLQLNAIATQAKARATLSPEAAARGYLQGFAGLYRSAPGDMDALVLHHVETVLNGASLVKFINQRDGIEVFRESAAVLMDKSLGAMAIGGFVSSNSSATVLSAIGVETFRLGAADAVATALADFGYQGSVAGELQPRTVATGPLPSDAYQGFALPVTRLSADGAWMSDPARAKRVWFRLPEGLVPGYYVELQMGDTRTRDIDYYAYVIAADDGRILFRHNQTADAAFTYKTWAEGSGINLPYPGPQGRNGTPHPTGLNDGFQGAFVPQNSITLQNGPISTNDPWLDPGATRTIGNNVEAWANHTGPAPVPPATDPQDSIFNPDPNECDMAAPQVGDFHACLSAPGAFEYTFDPAVAPKATKAQAVAAVVNLFYMNNWLHDWYYDAGFREIDGNAQTINYGRGGLGNDSIRAQGQDYSGVNNANMSTPSDGSRPRMRMYIFSGNGGAALTATTPGAYAVGTANFGPKGFNVETSVVLANDGSGVVTDGCQPLVNNVAGQIALIDRGTCSFRTKVQNAQAAGAVGVIIANNVAGVVTMGDDTTLTTPITIPALSISITDGNAFKTAMLGVTVTAHLQRVTGVDRDGTLDNAIIAHEWGHYISNRLIGNSAGLTTIQARGLGEGWADFHAMLMMVKAEDALVAANANFGGTYAEAGYVSDGPQVPGLSQSHGYYDGIRRYPYSTNLAKNPLMFRHIQTGQALPTSPPPAFISDNAEVHNTGEVWTSMLWGCYASLLRDTGRLTFAQAQDRMKRYVVAAYKLTPVTPTFIEARDALFAAIQANDTADLPGCMAAFAARGAGLRATSGDRFSATNAGVVESFAAGDDVQITDVQFDARARLFCDADPYLDNGETGRLTAVVKNTGADTLSGVTVSLSTGIAAVSFPAGALVTLGPLPPLGSATATFDVALSGAAPVSTASISVTANHPSLAIPGGVLRSFTMATQRDSVPAAAAIDDVEANTSAWTPSLQGAAAPALAWTRIAASSLDHYWKGPTGNSAGAAWLTSPPLQVAAAGTFSMSFRHRHSFEWSGTTNYDGGVIEVSTDNGVTWADVQTLVAGVYNGTVSTYTGDLNPFAGRPGFVAQSAGYPAFVTKTINFPASLLGRTVLVRFGAGSDESTGLAGWDLDDIAFANITNTPFAGYVNDQQHCVSASAIAGTPQTVNINTAFPTALQARVLAFGGAPVAGVTVSFQAPASGAGGTFSGGAASASVQTDAGGFATAPSFTANGSAGSYNVVASVGLSSVSFPLTNASPLLASTAVVTATPNPSVQGGTITVSATVSGSSATPTGTVLFWADGAPGIGIPLPGCGARPLAGGVGTCNFSSFAAGSHTITAEYSGDGVYSTSDSAPYSQVVNAGPATLTVTRSGVGNGVVTSAPAGIGCGATCSAQFAGGTSVTLTAAPNPSSIFSGWVGCDSVAGNQCTVQMSANASVNAAFRGSGGSATDFNADGKPDLIWSNTVNGATFVWYMNGPLLVSDAFLAGIDPAWKIQGVADFNGDGQPDLVWRNAITGNSYVWYMNGSTFISDAFLFSLPPEWVIQGVADFNGDGKPDFLMRNTNTGVAFVWFFNNATAIGDQFLFGIDPVWKVEAVADLNSDGQPDLLFRNMASGLAFAWNTQNSAGTLSLAGSSAPIFSIDPAWEVVQMADWNNDGRADLVFRNRNTGLVFVWYMADLTLQGSDFITQIDPSWEIVPRR